MYVSIKPQSKINFNYALYISNISSETLCINFLTSVSSYKQLATREQSETLYQTTTAKNSPLSTEIKILRLLVVP